MKLGDLKRLLETASDDTDISDLLPSKETIRPVNNFVSDEIPVEGAVANVKHYCNPGDVIASLVVCKKYYERTGRKIRFLQKINHRAAYYAGAVHPTVDESGANVTMNRPMFNMIKPLVESQEYIESFQPYDGEEVHIDFDTIRNKTFVNMPHGSIQAWLFYAFVDLYSDISKPWMTLKKERQQIEEVTKNKILLNFTERYRNPQMNIEYFFLRKYSPELIFAGTAAEHFKFCSDWGVNMPLLEVKDFLELAYAIRGARFLLSNQSMMWNLATALGTPRVLEVCPFAQNCMPFYGEDNVGYLNQEGLQFHFLDFYTRTMKH